MLNNNYLLILQFDRSILFKPRAQLQKLAWPFHSGRLAGISWSARSRLQVVSCTISSDHSSICRSRPQGGRWFRAILLFWPSSRPESCFSWILSPIASITSLIWACKAVFPGAYPPLSWLIRSWLSRSQRLFEGWFRGTGFRWICPPMSRRRRSSQICALSRLALVRRGPMAVFGLLGLFTGRLASQGHFAVECINKTRK